MNTYCITFKDLSKHAVLSAEKIKSTLPESVYLKAYNKRAVKTIFISWFQETRAIYGHTPLIISIN